MRKYKNSDLLSREQKPERSVATKLNQGDAAGKKESHRIAVITIKIKLIRAISCNSWPNKKAIRLRCIA